MQLPVDGMGGVDLQRQLGELTFAEVASEGRDAEAILGGSAPTTKMGPEQIKVGLLYGQLTSGDAKGTRVLVKRYGARANNALSRSAGDDSEAARIAMLEAALAGRGGVSVAEALAENEFAAHLRVQAGSGKVEEQGLARLLGRNSPDAFSDDPAILLAFPWRGEQVRMALPTSLPPTLESWASARARGATPGAKYDASVPRKGLEERGRFVRSALRGCLQGLASLHAVDLVHQSLTPSAVGLSGEDDRVGDKAKGWLGELGFCRDAPSLELAYRAGPEGDVLPAYEGTTDVLSSGLLDRAARKCRRPQDPAERARFGKADDMREFGMLMLQSVMLPNAPPGERAPLDALQLRTLCDGAFAASDDGMPTDGVDVLRLREYLDAEDGLRLGGVGGVDVLDVGGPERSGWDLLALILAADWEDRPSAEEALKHPFWSAKMFF